MSVNFEFDDDAGPAIFPNRFGHVQYLVSAFLVLLHEVLNIDAPLDPQR